MAYEAPTKQQEIFFRLLLAMRFQWMILCLHVQLKL